MEKLPVWDELFGRDCAILFKVKQYSIGIRGLILQILCKEDKNGDHQRCKICGCQ